MSTAMQLQAKSIDVPDETRTFGSKGRIEFLHLGDVTAVRATFQPGFRWTEHARPVVGTDLCQARHVGYVISGRSGIRLADGTERELAAGDFFDVPPGHDAWVIGDEPYVTVDIALAPPNK
jgi:quercetin dioxygenase-like cupin family protein